MGRSSYLKIRVSADETKRFSERAAALGVSVSQLIRDAALNGAVQVSIDKSQAGYEFRRVSAALKSMSLSEDIHWTSEDREKWWALVQELRGRANQLESLAMGQDEGRVAQGLGAN